MNVFSTSYPDPSPLPVETLDGEGYELALTEARQNLDAAPAPPLDAVIHGVSVRLHTDNAHWRQFWSANWFAPHQWATLMGGLPPAEPQAHLYAVADRTVGHPRVRYSRRHNTAFLTGDPPYGPLRALALGTVGRLLAEEQAVHLVPGLCFTRNEQGILWLSPDDTDQGTIIETLLAQDNIHVIALSGTFIRYGLRRMVDGITLLPTLVIDEKGNTIPGHRLFPWLDEYGYWEPRADAHCLTLEGEEEYCFARDLDLGRTPEAFAFPLEQAWYVPTQIIATAPELIGVLWHGGMENVPPLTLDLLDQYGAWARQATSALSETTSRPSTRSLLEELGQEQLVEALCRLRAASHGRVMVLPEHLWPGRAGGHPWHPVQIEQVQLVDNGRPQPFAPEALIEHLAGGDANLVAPMDKDSIRNLATMLGRATYEAD